MAPLYHSGSRYTRTDAPEGAYAKAWDLNGEKATLAVEKAEA